MVVCTFVDWEPMASRPRNGMLLSHRDHENLITVCVGSTLKIRSTTPRGQRHTRTSLLQHVAMDQSSSSISRWIISPFNRGRNIIERCMPFLGTRSRRIRLRLVLGMAL
jgi:hypothetical protein